MKTYNQVEKPRQEVGELQSPTEHDTVELGPDTPFTQVAFEWNNALMLAIEKLWCNHAPQPKRAA
jgi:hypothetical protein